MIQPKINNQMFQDLKQLAKLKNKTMIKKIDILTDSTNLFSFVQNYYNTKEQTQIRNGNKILFQGLISLSTQGAGTGHQKQTYLNLQIRQFITNIKK